MPSIDHPEPRSRKRERRMAFRREIRRSRFRLLGFAGIVTNRCHLIPPAELPAVGCPSASSSEAPPPRVSWAHPRPWTGQRTPSVLRRCAAAFPHAWRRRRAWPAASPAWAWERDAAAVFLPHHPVPVGKIG